MKPILAAGIRTHDTQGALFFTENGAIVKFVKLSFDPHAFYQNPQDPFQFYVFVKEGQQSAVINLNKDESVVYFDSSPRSLFYGHAQFSSDGSVFYSSERMLNGKGRVVIRDSKTLKILNIFQLPGFGPHDLVLLESGKTLAVVMENYVYGIGKFSTSEVLFLDSQTGEIKSRSELDHENLSLGHLNISKSGTVFALMHDPDKLRNRPMAHGRIGEKLQTLDSDDQITDKLKGQALSLVVDEDRGIVAITYPDDHQFMLWDLNSKKLLFQTAEIKAVGVSLSSDQSGFMVTADFGQVFKVNGSNFEISKEFQLGEHIFYAHHHLFFLPR